jgi:hypothetical protein
MRSATAALQKQWTIEVPSTIKETLQRRAAVIGQNQSLLVEEALT